MMYNKNIYCHYTLSYIMTINIFIIYKDVFLLYKTMYNDNKYFYYTRRCIIKIYFHV